MDESVLKRLSAYNQLWMELDDLYGSYAKQCGLSDCAFWIFYSIYENKEAYTQKDLAEKLSLSRQTVNSALKTLASDGYISLVPLDGQRKNKQIVLTESGKNIAQRSIKPIVNAEQSAFSKLNTEEQQMLLCLTQKHITLLQAETNKILNASSED